MKCFSCQTRKGKRFCPARKGSICARCCGEKRVVEIDCPPHCSYLSAGEFFRRKKDLLSQLSEIGDMDRRIRFLRGLSQFQPVLFELESVIARYAAPLTSLQDSQVLEALAVLSRTYQTEERGLLYQHTSPDPLAQALSRELGEVLEELRRGDSEDIGRLELGEILDCLAVLQNQVEFHLQQGGARRRYLSRLARRFPELQSQPGGLILP